MEDLDGRAEINPLTIKPKGKWKLMFWLKIEHPRMLEVLVLNKKNIELGSLVIPIVIKS